MSKHLPHSVFVFQVNELCCLPCIDKNKKRLLKFPGIVEVDADVEKKTLTIKGGIHIVELITMFQKIYVNANLVYYKKERWEGHDQRKENCGRKDDDCSEHDESEDIGADCHEKHGMFKDYNERKERHGKKEKEYSWNDDEVEDIGTCCHKKRDMFKDYNQRNEMRGKKEKQCSWNDDEVEDIGADHYKVRDTFKDHKPEVYVRPSKECFWGDVRSGMQKKFPRTTGADSWYTAGFSNYESFHYPAPWPQGDYM